MILVYTDGSTRPTNPGPAGYGVVIIEDDKEIHHCSAFIGKETNNVAEIRGIEYALDYLSEQDKSWSDILICTDSKYCIGLFSKNWNARKNIDLVKKVRAKLENFPNLNFKWIKGHSGDHYNEIVDVLASTAVESQITKKGGALDG